MIVLSDLVPVSPICLMGGRLVQGGGGQLESRRPRIGRRGALPIAERRHPTNLDSTLAVITTLQKSDKKHAGTQPHPPSKAVPYQDHKHSKVLDPIINIGALQWPGRSLTMGLVDF